MAVNAEVKFKMATEDIQRHSHRFLSVANDGLGRFYIGHFAQGGTISGQYDSVQTAHPAYRRLGSISSRTVCRPVERRKATARFQTHIITAGWNILFIMLLLYISPPVTSVNLTVGYLPTIHGDYPDKQGLSISGAITYALEQINNDHNLLPNVTLVLRWNDTHSDLLRTTKALSDMMCQNVVAIFGPENTCNVEATIASAWNRLMISHKCADYTVSDKKKFPTFVRTYPTEKQVTKSIVSLLKQYEWFKFSIVEENSPRWKTVADSLEELGKMSNLTINHREPFEDSNLCCVNKQKCCHAYAMYDVVDKTKQTTRIYVFLGEPIHLYQFMTTMQMLRLFEKGEYMVISVDWEPYRPERARDYLWSSKLVSEYHNCSQLESPSKEAAQSLLMIVTSPPDSESFTNFSNKVREFNAKEPFSFRNPFKIQTYISMYAAHLYDAVMLYARALDQILKRENITNPQAIEAAAKDGQKLFEEIKKNNRYTSVTGTFITIDEKGDAEGNYTVLAYQPHNSSEPIANTTTKAFYCDYHMIPIGTFHRESDDSMKFKENITIIWPGGRKPPDEPKCGYKGEHCSLSEKRLRNSQIAAGVLGAIFLVAVVITLFVYRKWKVEQEIAGLVWKIDPKDIVGFENVGNGFMGKTSSKLSLASAASGVDQIFASLGRYQGTMVRIKELKFSKRREICRKTMKEMRLMREIRQDNINPFIGAVVEPTKIYIVTEYCTKGSLPDILENEDIKLDSMFVASLVHDLLRGMIYLQKTDLHCHGNLKSSNCVVSSRWVLQITDFGLHELRQSAECDSVGDHQFNRNLLWKAPELLRDPNAPIRGTQKGDVYAFGIILFEILARQDPYGMYKLDPKEIIDRIKRGPQPGELPFRPDMQVVLDTEMGCQDYIRNCMQDCWAENPDTRPDFPTIRDRLRKMREGMKPSIMDQIMEMLVKYANDLEDLVNKRTRLLYEEKQKTEDLLHRMLPKPVAERLTGGFGVEPEAYEAVTIYFSDIVGFTKMSAESTPFQVVNFLNDLYVLFDSIIQGYDVYKVETIGDAYMVVSGLPLPNEDRHAGEIASMALDLLAAVSNYKIAHRPKDPLLLRIGIHTGPVVAGVVGLTMPRYCLFGDTVNTASRMESNGEPLRIHISSQCRQALEKIGGYTIEERGLVALKGKGDVLTHWLVGANANAIKRKTDTRADMPPLFCRPSVIPGNNGSASNMSDLKRRSPRLISRADSMMGRRVSTDSRHNTLSGMRLPPFANQASKLAAMSNYPEPQTECLESSRTQSFCSSHSNGTVTPHPSERPTPAHSLRSIRTNNDSLRRSCLLSCSAASQVQIITDDDPVEYRNHDNCSPCLGQRRCQSLGKFPGGSSNKSLSSAGRNSVGSNTPRTRQFLCVPQSIHSGNRSRRRRKESKSLDVFPSEMRPMKSDRSLQQSCASEERVCLLDDDIVLTIPNGVDCRANGGFTEYDTTRFLQNDDEGIDVNSEASTKAKRLSVCKSEDKKWHSCEELHPIEGEKRDSVPTVSVNKSFKQWVANVLGFRHSDEFTKNSYTSPEHRRREESESVV